MSSARSRAFRLRRLNTLEMKTRQKHKNEDLKYTIYASYEKKKHKPNQHHVTKRKRSLRMKKNTPNGIRRSLVKWF